GELSSERSQQRHSAMIVLDVGYVHQHGEQRAGRIGDDVTLAALHPLGRIKPAWTATFRGFHALAIDHAGRRNDVAPCYPANLLDKSKIDPTPNALVAPAVEIILNGRARRKVFRQRAPLAASRENVEDGVHH